MPLTVRSWFTSLSVTAELLESLRLRSGSRMDEEGEERGRELGEGKGVQMEREEKEPWG